MAEQTTQLANQVIMEIHRKRNLPGNTEQFFAIATRLLMRRLISYQRARFAAFRGGQIVEEPGATDPDGKDAERVRAALDELHETDPRKAEVVTLDLWRGLPLPQVAERLEVSLPTVERDCRGAKAWLAVRPG